jgi:hypothetical protein
VLVLVVVIMIVVVVVAMVVIAVVPAGPAVMVRSAEETAQRHVEHDEGGKEKDIAPLHGDLPRGVVTLKELPGKSARDETAQHSLAQSSNSWAIPPGG